MLTKNAIHKCRPLYLLLALRIIHPKMPISGVIQLCFSWFCKNFVQLCFISLGRGSFFVLVQISGFRNNMHR